MLEMPMSEAASFTLIVPGSIWLNQSGRSGWPSRFNLLTKVAWLPITTMVRRLATSVTSINPTLSA